MSRYADAGVDRGRAQAAVARVAELAATTHGPSVMEGIGPFAAVSAGLANAGIIPSSNGKANVAPKHRRKVWRGIAFLKIIMASSSPA